MPMHGLRGATTATSNTAEAIYTATRELLEALTTANDLCEADLASVFFTMSPDLNAAYPAYAARQLGWRDVALMCAQEVDVPDSVPYCIRVLIHWNTDQPQNALRHIYLREAARLRPDRAVYHHRPEAVTPLG